jgi:hypothetical protein
MSNNHDLPLDSQAPINHGRRGGRVSSKFWVKVNGWDDESVLRSGDLAATGAYIATTEPWGSPGDVVMLELQSLDNEASLSTLARVARVLRQDDRNYGARVVGVALEFLPMEAIQPAATALVRCAVERELVRHGNVRLDEPALAYVHTSHVPAPLMSAVSDVGLEQVTLQTPLILPYGTDVELEISVNDGVVRLDGQVVASQPMADSRRFSTLVHLKGAIEGRQSVLVDLAKQVIMPDDCTTSAESGFDFSGELGPVTVDAVLRLLSHSCYSGVLSIGNEAEFYSVQISQGTITEVESTLYKTREGALDGLKGLGAGEFRFRYRCRAQLPLVSPMTTRLVEDVLAQSAV